MVQLRTRDDDIPNTTECGICYLQVQDLARYIIDQGVGRAKINPRAGDCE